MSQEDQADPGQSIAICGIGCHLPGASGPAQYWKLLREGTEAIRTYTKDELLSVGVREAELRRPDYVRRGAPLAQMEWFDAEFFGLSPKDAAIMDPQHRHFLECCWEAFEDAAIMPEDFKGRIGTFAGCGMGAYFAFNLLRNPALIDDVGLFLLRHTGNDKDFLSTRASFLFNLRGPSVNVQTACSTSLVAVHQASASLLNYECDLALAGGVTIELPHGRGYRYVPGEILSPTGQVRAFDAASKGTVFGSGAVVVVLRRLQDALEAGDPIYAVIRGSAINNDGHSKSDYLAPSADGQVECIVEAQTLAGVSPDEIGYVETHGTGTAIGDPIEVNALTRAFRRASTRTHFCGIGSVKGNIGHLDTAAGGASLVKTALALRHRELPPSLHFESPNPDIDFEHSPFFVNATLKPWEVAPGTRRIAGVTSLGVGGTNAHVVLEEAPVAVRPPRGASSRPTVLMLSARSTGALDDLCTRLADAIEADPAMDLADVALTLAKGRRHFNLRRVMAVTGREDAIACLRERDARRVFAQAAGPAPEAGEPFAPVFMFPGGGATHLDMSRDLFERDPEFRRDVMKGFDLMRRRSGVDLKQLIYPDAQADRAALEAQLHRPSLQLPALFTIEVALAKRWMRAGVKPAALIGHSVGENTAGHLAGVFRFEDALGLVALRGELFERVRGGGMLSVTMSAAELEPYLAGEVDLACVNAPDVCVVSGTGAALEALRARLESIDVGVQPIAIDVAAHSRLLEPILAEFNAYLASIPLGQPQIPIVSNLTGTWLTAEQAQDPAYWTAHLRGKVEFAAGIRTLCAEKGRVLVEVGPGRTLSSLARMNPEVPGTGATVLATQRHVDERVDDEVSFLNAMARAWAIGQPIDVGRLVDLKAGRRINLPTYPFQRQRYWIDAAPGALVEPEVDAPLEKLAAMADWYSEPVWSPAEPVVRPIPAGPWLVFLDDLGIGKAIVDRLRGEGHQVVTVQEGYSFAQLADDAFALAPEDGAAGYESLARTLAARKFEPRRLLHLWLLTERENFRVGSSFAERNLERGFYCLFHLFRALATEGLVGDLRLLAATNGMQSVRDAGAGRADAATPEAIAWPEKATILGPIRVLPREFPGLGCTAVDFDLPHRPSLVSAKLAGMAGRRSWAQRKADVTAQLLMQLGLDADPPVVAWRDARHYVQTLRRVPAEAAARRPAPLLKRGGRYLITGGFGGIGRTLATMLAERYAPRLTLLTRTSLPERGLWDDASLAHEIGPEAATRIAFVRQLEARGAQVNVVDADLTDAAATRQAIARAEKAFGGIDGVIHAAGYLSEGPMLARPLREIEKVLEPKVVATLSLGEALRRTPLDFLVAFSSTSAVLGPPGQIDYVAANAFLDAFVLREGRPAQRFESALAWGIWNEVGMAARMLRERQPGQPDGEPIAHFLFERLVRAGDGVVELRARCKATDWWMIDEHRTRTGQALLPGTGHVQLYEAAFRQIGGSARFAIENLLFLRPLFVADDEPQEIRVRFVPDSRGYAVTVSARRVRADGSEYVEACSEATLLTASLPPPPPHDLPAVQGRMLVASPTPDGDADLLPQAGHMAFGQRWRVLRAIRLGLGEALAELELGLAFHSDLANARLHPALLDMATGFAFDLIPDYRPDAGLWMPFGYGRIEVHRPLQPKMIAWARVRDGAGAGSGFAEFDVDLCDPQGEVLVSCQRFTVRFAGAVDAIQMATAPAQASPTLAPVDESHAVVSGGEDGVLASRLQVGILPAEGAQAFVDALETYRRPRLVVSSTDLDRLGREIERETMPAPTQRGALFARPAGLGATIAPRDDLERALASLWEGLLGVANVGVQDDFFALGGHSLIAVRLFAQIKKTLGADMPISVLFEAPTIEKCAELIRRRHGDLASAADPLAPSAPIAQGSRFLVNMSVRAGTQAPPLYIIAGQYGNVLNLRHLAQMVGMDRSVYGLQAKGLYGESGPHLTFEEAAADYLAEIRRVQPQGPYHIGGYSGGGIVALEMARQLIANGERVGSLLFLDTFLPKFETTYRINQFLAHMRKLSDRGLMHVIDTVRARAEGWLAGRLVRKDEAIERHFEFDGAEVGQAFNAARVRYALRRYDGRIHMLRPRPIFAARYLTSPRAPRWFREVYPSHGWTRYCEDVDVTYVPGSHSSMVLEPHVVVLADRIRTILLDSDRMAANEAPSTPVPPALRQPPGPEAEPSRPAPASELT